MTTPRHPSKPLATATDSVWGEVAEASPTVEIIAQLLANAAQRCWENRETGASEGDDKDSSELNGSNPHASGKKSKKTPQSTGLSSAIERPWRPFRWFQ